MTKDEREGLRQTVKELLAAGVALLSHPPGDILWLLDAADEAERLGAEVEMLRRFDDEHMPTQRLGGSQSR